MTNRLKALIAAVFGLTTLGLAAASAEARPLRCDYDHDHRVHDQNYYDYFPGDRYFRGGHDRRVSGYGVRTGGRGAYGYYGNGYRARGGRVLFHRILETRFRARIVLREEIIRRRRGDFLICTVAPRGPEAAFVPYRRLRRVALNFCSPRARIRILA